MRVFTTTALWSATAWRSLSIGAVLFGAVAHVAITTGCAVAAGAAAGAGAGYIAGHEAGEEEAEEELGRD